MKVFDYDYLIVGAGMVGMSIAYQLKNINPKNKICILEKEPSVGLHSSGRNSGVIHAGIYYEPESLKAKLCTNGARRLKDWCKDQKINVFECGKVITPQTKDLDFQLDVLLKRGQQNGAEVEIIEQKKFNKLVPNGRTSTGRALWSPKTSVVSSIEVVKTLSNKLESMGVRFLFNSKPIKFNSKDQSIDIINTLNNEKHIASFGHFFNCAGLQADKIGKLFGVGNALILIPFKGTYWKLRANNEISFKTNLYPVPDLNMPFLGVHVTPSMDGSIYLGPTALPAFGSENYYGFNGLEPINAINNLGIMLNQWFRNKNNFRAYSSQQAILGIKSYFFQSAKLLIPSLQINDLLPCKKVGIRPQLFNKENGELCNDFYIENTACSTHVLNSISPAFTASFAFADYVIHFGLNK